VRAEASSASPSASSQHAPANIAPAQSYLLATFHKAYWMGTKAPNAKEFIAWLDSTVRPPFNSSQKHWGMDAGVLQPDNAGGMELCAVANASMAYGRPSAWGWQDVDCDRKFVFMCRMIRGWRVLGLAACPAIAAALGA
jgi:hypothetical protein